MKALIDADVLSYEIGFSGQSVDEDSGEIVPRRWEKVAELLDEKIKSIQEAVWADEEPTLYLTYDRALNRLDNKERARQGLPQVEFTPNFRFDVAKAKPYKERGNAKPFWYNALRAYMLFNYDVKVVPGLEADDAICVDQMARIDKLDTIICTRDKDLRMCPGWHYGWECGLQEGFGPKLIDNLGELWIKVSQTKKGPVKEAKGYGPLFFYSQMITGDNVDSIPGLPRGGAALVEKHLVGCEDLEEADRIVRELYQAKLGDDYEEYFNEQAKLLWMVREIKEGCPVSYGGEVLRVPVGEPMVRRGVSFQQG